MTTDHVLVDTNIIVFQLGGNEKAERILQDIKAHVPFVTEVELLGHPGSTERDRTTVREALAQMRIADINREIKETAARIKREHRLKLGDAIVAATAIYLNIPLLTADRDFMRLKDELTLRLFPV